MIIHDYYYGLGLTTWFHYIPLYIYIYYIQNIYLVMYLFFQFEFKTCLFIVIRKAASLIILLNDAL